LDVNVKSPADLGRLEKVRGKHEVGEVAMREKIAEA
jgi:hypothetical protein